MSQHTCPQGHQWEVGSPKAATDVCPICGAEPTSDDRHDTLSVETSSVPGPAAAAGDAFTTLSVSSDAPAAVADSYSTLSTERLDGPAGTAKPRGTDYSTLSVVTEPAAPAAEPVYSTLSVTASSAATPAAAADSYSTLSTERSDGPAGTAKPGGTDYSTLSAVTEPAAGADAHVAGPVYSTISTSDHAAPTGAVPLADEVFPTLPPSSSEPSVTDVNLSAKAPLAEHDSQRTGSLDKPLPTLPLSDAGPGTPPTQGRAQTPSGADQPPGYEILGVLGRGGMGVVYKARQDSLERIVALKMVLAGAHASPQQLGRFRAEAEAVAHLQHANIVQIHEVSEHRGLPYFALEYLDGGSLADTLDGTPQPARRAAQLVETLATAMHYAHQQGVVHRDLKPANILLTVVGKEGNAAPSAPTTDSQRVTTIPKISDFGLAKRLEEGSKQTQSGAILGTPSYMAPEQAAGTSRDVGPAADVYALGAILYELLTGRPPFRAATSMETVRQVLTDEPLSPARLLRSVPRDLDTICLKCLQKEPHKRYPSAEALADDLGRYLRGEPIRARPSTFLERLSKWARRRPAVAGLVGVSALAVVLLLAGWVWFTITWRQERDLARQAHWQAECERERAGANLELAMEAVDKMLTGVAEEKLSREPHMQEKQRLLLQEALAFYEKFLAQKSTDPEVQSKTGLAHKRTADILRKLGRSQEAAAAYEQAIDLLDRLVAERPGVGKYRQALAESYNWQGELLRTAFKPAEARAAYEKALGLQQKLVDDFGSEPSYRKDLARSHNNLGILFDKTNQPREADRAFRQAIDILDNLYRQDRTSRECRHELALGLLNHSSALRAQGKGREAEAALVAALQHLRGLTADDPHSPDYRFELLVAYTNAGNYYGSKPGPPVASPRLVGTMAAPFSPPWAALAAAAPGTPRKETFWCWQAEEILREAVALGSKLADDFPRVPTYRNYLASAYNSLGAVAFSRDWALADQAWGEARDILEKLVAEFGNQAESAEYRGDLGMTLGNLGWLRGRQGRWPEAPAYLDRSIELVKAALKPNPKHPTYLQTLRDQYRHLANTLVHLKDHAGAERAALALSQVFGASPRNDYQGAYFLAQCVTLARDDTSRSGNDREDLCRRYANQAMKLLQQAARRGYKDMATALRKDQAFDVLRQRPDFGELLAHVSK